jgi:hypothetical protein
MPAYPIPSIPFGNVGDGKRSSVSITSDCRSFRSKEGDDRCVLCLCEPVAMKRALVRLLQSSRLQQRLK